MTDTTVEKGEGWGTETFYDKWVNEQKIPVVSGYAVEDLNTVAVEPWGRKGGKGAFVILEGAEGVADAYVCEIPAGQSLKPQRHLFEEMIYVLSGSGATSMWWDNGQKQTFEWQTGSLFAPPLNVWHQHFNGSGNTPVRYMAVTSAPLMLNLIHNSDFLFQNDFAFTDRFPEEAEYFNPSKGKLHPGRVWESNFIPDVRSLKLHEWIERGAGGSNIRLELSHNTMAAHISEFPIGTYKKAHRHGPAAHVILLNGEGFSLMWPEGGSRMKIPWRAGSMLVPPDRWFHQHFNVGSTPARYLALRWNSRKYPMGKAYQTDQDVKSGGDQIEYRDQDPGIEAEFKAECAERGVVSKMARFF
ncbi:MAG: cupin domain-containing protein [Desulfobacterales bacterium]|nr:cupin domain-containing protein [Desulfobacterales bacterium]